MRPTDCALQWSLSTRDKLGMGPMFLVEWSLSTRDKLGMGPLEWSLSTRDKLGMGLISLVEWSLSTRDKLEVVFFLEVANVLPLWEVGLQLVLCSEVVLSESEVHLCPLIHGEHKMKDPNAVPYPHYVRHIIE